jgi:hypothetical protein
MDTLFAVAGAVQVAEIMELAAQIKRLVACEARVRFLLASHTGGE